MSHEMFEAPGCKAPVSMPSVLLRIESGLQRFARSLRWACGSAVVAMLLSACGGGNDQAVSPDAQAQRNQAPAAVQTQHSVSRMIAALVQPGSGSENFESGMADWQNWGNAQVVAGAGTSGSNALQVGTAAGGAGLTVPSVVAGTEYRLTANVRVSDVSDPGVLGVNFYNAAGDQLAAYTSPQAMGTTYAPLTLDATAPANSASALVWVWKNAGTGYVYVDDVAFGAATTSPPPPADTNLMSNGGFEAGMAGWADWGNTHVVSGQANSGTSALSVGTAAGGAGYIVDGLVAGQTYRMSVSAKVSDASDAVIVGVNFLDAGGSTVADTQRSTTSTSYTTLSSDVIAPAGTVRALVYVWKNAGSGLGYVDDFWFGSASGSPPPPSPASDNLVVNGSFDAGLSSWVNWGNTAIASSAAMAQVGPDAGGFTQSVPGIVAGKTYRLTALANVSVAGDSALLGLQFLDAAGNALQDQLVPFSSTTVSMVQTQLVAPANVASALVYVWKNAGSGFAYVDDVTLTQVADPGPAPTSLIQPGPFAPFDEAILSPNFDSTARGQFSAARLTGNGSVVAWSTGSSVLLQRLDVDGHALGAAQTAGTVVTGDRNVNTRVSVVATADGGWLVAWIAADRSLLFRRYDASGAPIADPSPVDTTAFTSVLNVQARALANGDFVVAWTAAEGTGPTHAFVRRFSAAGVPVTDRVSVGNSAVSQGYVQIAPMPDGNFMAAWQQPNTDGTYTVFARRLDAAFNGAGPEQVLDAAVHAYPTSLLGTASLSSGRVLIAWGYDASFAPQVRWQLLDASGTPLLPIASPGSSDPVTGAILDSVEVIPAGTGFRVVAESFIATRFGERAVTTLVEVGASGERLSSTNTTRTLDEVNRTEPTGCSGPDGSAPGVAAAGGEDGHYLLAYAVCPAPTVPATWQHPNVVVMGR